MRAVLLALVLAAGPVLAADIARLLPHEGRILRADGSPERGLIQVTFRTYESATGGGAVWTEAHDVVLGSNGYYALELGGTAALPPLDGRDYWLGISIMSEAEMAPRARLGAAAYALRAQSALEADRLTTAGAARFQDALDWGRIFEAEDPPANAATGAVVSDPTASGGKARRAAFGDATQRAYQLTASMLGEPLGRSSSLVEMRLKVLTIASTSPIVRLACHVVRAGAGSPIELDFRQIAPSHFAAANTWQTFRLGCAFRPDDADQRLYMDFTGAITDLSMDTVRVVPVARPFEGFSVYTSGSSKAIGWGRAMLPLVKFNTFASSWDPATSIFTAPYAGYYRFSAGGFISTPTAGTDMRMATGIVKNGAIESFSGANLSAADSPTPSHVQVLLLVPGDQIEADVFSPIAVNLGAGSAGHGFWFQGEYLGR